jgi:hypothetical protein
MVATSPLQRIHSDIFGSMLVKFFANNRYFITFIDKFTHFCCVYSLAFKSQAFETFKNFCARVELKFNAKITELHSDRGGEYMSTEFTQYLLTQGVFCQLTNAETPEQNGIAKRKNRTIIEGVCSMAADDDVPAFLWEELVKSAVYLQNQCSTRALSKATPYQKHFKHKPIVTNLRVIGSSAQIWISKSHRNKLESKSRLNTILVGYDDTSKGYGATLLAIAKSTRVQMSIPTKILDRCSHLPMCLKF